jgi:hypothetical protein
MNRLKALCKPLLTPPKPLTPRKPLLTGAFDVFYPNLHKARLVPVMWVSQGATVGDNDAAFFKKNVSH